MYFKRVRAFHQPTFLFYIMTKYTMFYILSNFSFPRARLWCVIIINHRITWQYRIRVNELLLNNRARIVDNTTEV